MKLKVGKGLSSSFDDGVYFKQFDHEHHVVMSFHFVNNATLLLLHQNGDHKEQSRSVEMNTKNKGYGLWIGFCLGGVLLTLAVVLWFFKPNQTEQKNEPSNSSTEGN